VRGVLTVGLLYIPAVLYFSIDPTAIATGLSMASAGFLLLYLLCALAYVITAQSIWRRLAAVVVLAIAGGTLAIAGTSAIPALTVFALVYVVSGRHPLSALRARAR
jgi:hypothetical protein